MSVLTDYQLEMYAPAVVSDMLKSRGKIVCVTTFGKTLTYTMEKDGELHDLKLEAKIDENGNILGYREIKE